MGIDATSTPRRIRGVRCGVGLVLLALLAGLLGAAPATAGRSAAAAQPAAADQPLTNLAHLDWLGDTVTPPAQDGHTTWRLAAEPAIGVLWTYADRQADGSYKRIGGGTYDPETDTYGQGAFNADDVSRAAVVYLRHWRATGAASSRERAYQMLRGLTYLQTASGPNAGNVVLWMQPDGTLNPSAEPVELPDPSDSGPSYWLARTIWALGEGYAAFRSSDAAFAGFLRDRLDLAVAAVDRQVLRPRYGTYQVVDGARVPAWLIVDGADASAEAVLGLVAYVRAGGGPAARSALRKLAEGIALLSDGRPRDWPFGAILPWGLSRSVWHAWGGLAPAALVRAGLTLADARLWQPAALDTGSFTSHLLVSAGPENGWLPSPTDRTQIAYGADSRLQSLLTLADGVDRQGQRALAGVAASWYFGNNPAGAAMYDPATGRTYDGVSGEGNVNVNSGAESTIHGQLSMLALDAHPVVRDAARDAQVVRRVTWTLVEAESGTLSGGASVVTPESAWTGESLWGGGAYVSLPPGGRVTLAAPTGGERSLALPVVQRRAGAGTSTWRTGGTVLGTIDSARVGEQGVSPAPGMLDVVTLGRTFTGAATPTPVSATGARAAVEVDALLVQPEIEQVLLTGGGGRALLRSFATTARTVAVALPGSGRARLDSFDAYGRHVRTVRTSVTTPRVLVPAGGFAVAYR